MEILSPVSALLTLYVRELSCMPYFTLKILRSSPRRHRGERTTTIPMKTPPLPFRLTVSGCLILCLGGESVPYLLQSLTSVGHPTPDNRDCSMSPHRRNRLQCRFLQKTYRGKAVVLTYISGHKIYIPRIPVDEGNICAIIYFTMGWCVHCERAVIHCTLLFHLSSVKPIVDSGYFRCALVFLLQHTILQYNALV